MHAWFVFAVASSGIPGLLSALGIDWRSLVLNAIAFLITMAILAKYVYPVLIKALDNKQNELEAATKLEKQAKAELSEAQAEIGKLISAARHSAEEIIATAKTEAGELTKTSNEKAAAQAERIVSEAHDQLSHDVRTAREALKAETARLVAGATEALLGEKLNATSDAKLITKSLEQLASKDS
jgi:F-type H+-transporting ATPase subunit b